MKLTSDEIALIQRLRAEKAQHNAAQIFQQKAIAVAHAFNNWSLATDEDLTFSSFVNTFGYQHNDGKRMFDAVKRIHEVAWPQS